MSYTYNKMFNHYFKNTYTDLPIATYAEEFHFRSGECGTQLVTGFHYHNEFEVLLIEDGQIDFIVNHTKFTAKKNDIVLINPFDPHYSDCQKKLPRVAYRCIDFDVSLLSGLSDDFLIGGIISGRLRFKPLLSGKEHAEAAEIFDRLYRTVTVKNEFWTYGVKADVLNLFYYLLSGGLTEQTEPTASTLKITAFAKTVFRYIDENYMDKITSETAAEELSYNKSYFCRLFKKSFGDNFSNYLNFYRVSRARTLISEGETNMTKLAGAVGFDELSYFSSTFKKHFGVPPTAFRKNGLTG